MLNAMLMVHSPAELEFSSSGEMVTGLERDCVDGLGAILSLNENKEVKGKR